MTAGDEPRKRTLQARTRFHPSRVVRDGGILRKDAGPWSRTVHALLRHLERVDFDAAPRVVGSGFDDAGRETLTFIEGDVSAARPWSRAACHDLGALLRRLHVATASFEPPVGAAWRPWFGRTLGEPSGFGHCDFAPWNIVARGNVPHALIDWEHAGPVDPRIELAQVAWLNAKLHDEIVSRYEGLPPLPERAARLRAIVDGYELPARDRGRVVEDILSFVILATADEADQADIVRETRAGDVDDEVPWAIAWRARAAAWILRHRHELGHALR